MLEGHVEYRLKVASTKAQKKQRLDSRNHCEQKEEKQEYEAGFYLITPTKDGYLLSVPHSLCKAVCDAVRYQARVCLSRYATIPLLFSTSTTCTKRKRDGTATVAQLLEIHDDGLKLKASDPPRNSDTDRFLSLQQIHEDEKAKNKSEHQEKDKAPSSKDDNMSKKQRSSNRYNLKGTVDSISPIIVVDEPFALMELYDGGSAKPYSCVVVFQGTASLSCHDGIHPGDCISLRQVKRQRWKIPEEMKRRNFPHMVNRVPSHVFVLKDAKSLVWQLPKPAALPPLPSTPIPLVALQGRVVSREWASRGASPDEMPRRASYMLHSIDLELLSPSKQSTKQRHTLLVTYYPMAPSLSLSLRPGCVIQAVNIHCIGYTVGRVPTFFYGACLRSTISILQMPPPPQTRPGSGSRIDPQSPSIGDNGQENLSYPCRPLAFLSVQRSYLEYACRQELYRWYSDENNLANTSLPSFDEVAKVWWDQHCLETSQEAESATRNPYVEFFDHAPSTRGCRCPEVPQRLPCWIVLDKLRDYGLRMMQETLTNTIRQIRRGEDGIHKLQLGWTGSVQLTHGDIANGMLAQGIDVEDVASKGRVLYTGGKVIKDSAAREGVSREAEEATQQLLESASLANDHCVLPGTKVYDVPVPDLSDLKEHSEIATEVAATFAFGRLEGIVVSSICIGLSPGSDSISSKAGNTLPMPLHTAVSQDPKISLPQGACSIYESQGRLFVLSVQLKFNSLVPVYSTQTVGAGIIGDSIPEVKTTSAISKCSQEGNGNTQWYTIQQCLDPEAPNPLRGGEEEAGCIVGLLARPRFRLQGLADNPYRGYTLTLAHIPIHRAFARRKVSTLQTLEVKISIPYSNLEAKRLLLQALIAKILPVAAFSLKDAINIALSFWQVADNANACALLFCGWEDIPSRSTGSHSETTKKRAAVVVHLPGPVSCTQDPRGYKRFSCCLRAVSAGFLRFESPKRGAERRSEERGSVAMAFKVLDSMGGFKYFQGDLDRRPIRCFQRLEGLLQDEHLGQAQLSKEQGALVALEAQEWTGIPDCNLADMLRYVCFDLKNQQNTADGNEESGKTRYVAPSLVRKLSGARNLELTFCKAQVACSKCFQPFCHQDVNGRGGDKFSRKDVKKKDWGNDEERRRLSYWHNPLPIPFGGVDEEFDSDSGSRHPSSVASAFVSPVERSALQNLCCPNGCSLQSSAEVKWECSGMIDDGTGQAKLYAEREAAVMLLGMNQRQVEMIEAGAFEDKNCFIQFSKNVPPPTHLAKAVEAANYKYTDQEAKRKRNRKKTRSRDSQPEPEEVLKLLDPADRARYLMYQHCRYSKATTRSLDYLVRCKPLSDSVVHLNHTEVDVFGPGATEGAVSSQKAATYSLPPLKLNLVDCCLPSASTSDVLDETWNLICSLKEQDE